MTRSHHRHWLRHHLERQRCRQPSRYLACRRTAMVRIIMSKRLVHKSEVVPGTNVNRTGPTSNAVIHDELLCQNEEPTKHHGTHLCRLTQKLNCMHAAGTTLQSVALTLIRQDQARLQSHLVPSDHGFLGSAGPPAKHSPSGVHCARTWLEM